MERRWDMIRQKAQWGDLRRFYLEKCCHEADSRGTSNQTGLGMGVLNVGKVYNWYNRCSLWHKHKHKHKLNLQQNQLHFQRPSRLLLSFFHFLMSFSTFRSPSSITSKFSGSFTVRSSISSNRLWYLAASQWLPSSSVFFCSVALHCIAECLRKAALEVIRIQGAGVSRHTLCCFPEQLAITLLLSLSTSFL